jgi:hypothetical protein
MIRPTKYLDLNTCVLRVAAIVLSELRLSRAMPLDELDAIVRSRAGESARFNFLPALSFLFLTGKLDYDDDADAVLLSKEQEKP